MFPRYGVGVQGAKQFEKVMQNHVPELFRETPDLLHHVSPSVLSCVHRQNSLQNCFAACDNALTLVAG